MKLSLRDLFHYFTGGTRVRNTPRPPRTTRLEVESLEERAVPTAGLANHYFALPTGTLYITSENNQTGQFSGYFNEVSGAARITIPISGKLTQLGNSLEPMTFSGSTGTGLQKNSVSFSGYASTGITFYEPGGTVYAPAIDGTLTESFGAMAGHVTSDVFWVPALQSP